MGESEIFYLSKYFKKLKKKKIWETNIRQLDHQILDLFFLFSFFLFTFHLMILSFFYSLNKDVTHTNSFQLQFIYSVVDIGLDYEELSTYHHLTRFYKSEKICKILFLFSLKISLFDFEGVGFRF